VTLHDVWETVEHFNLCCVLDCKANMQLVRLSTVYKRCMSGTALSFSCSFDTPRNDWIKWL